MLKRLRGIQREACQVGLQVMYRDPGFGITKMLIIRLLLNNHLQRVQFPLRECGYRNNQDSRQQEYRKKYQVRIPFRTNSDHPGQCCRYKDEAGITSNQEKHPEAKKTIQNPPASEPVFLQALVDAVQHNRQHEKDNAILVYTRRKIKQGRKQETTDDRLPFLTRIKLYEEPVKKHMTEEDKKIEEKTIDIIIAPAQDVEQREQLDDHIPPQVVPIRIMRTEHTAIASFVSRSKQVGKIGPGIVQQQLVFIPGFPVEIPVVVGAAVIMNRYPPYRDARGHFDQEQPDERLVADPRIFKEGNLQQQPAQRKQVYGKQQVIQPFFFCCGKIVKIIALRRRIRTGQLLPLRFDGLSFMAYGS